MVIRAPGFHGFCVILIGAHHETWSVFQKLLSRSQLSIKEDITRSDLFWEIAKTLGFQTFKHIKFFFLEISLSLIWGLIRFKSVINYLWYEFCLLSIPFDLMCTPFGPRSVTVFELAYLISCNQNLTVAVCGISNYLVPSKETEERFLVFTIIQKV